MPIVLGFTLSLFFFFFLLKKKNYLSTILSSKFMDKFYTLIGFRLLLRVFGRWSSTLL